MFIGTPKGITISTSGGDGTSMRSRQPAWFSLELKASKTGLIPQAELDDMRRAMSADQYDQELEVSFDAAIRGAIYRAELAAADDAARICSVPYDPAVPVWTAWDLGVGNSTAIWCAQLVGREVHIIDYYEASGEALVHYVSWLDKKPYRYGLDILPHDAGARELGTGKTREETLRANGRKVRVLPAQSIEDGIEAVKMLLGRCWFDRERTARGRECLAHYRRDFNDKMGIYKDAPVHDWASDGADAMRYLAMGLREHTPEPVRLTPRVPLIRLGERAAPSWMGALMARTRVRAGDAELLREARARFERCQKWEAKARDNALADAKFAEGDANNMWQWTDAVRNSRGDRPCLTMNKVRQHNLADHQRRAPAQGADQGHADGWASHLRGGEDTERHHSPHRVSVQGGRCLSAPRSFIRCRPATACCG